MCQCRERRASRSGRQKSSGPLSRRAGETGGRALAFERSRIAQRRKRRSDAGSDAAQDVRISRETGSRERSELSRSSDCTITLTGEFLCRQERSAYYGNYCSFPIGSERTRMRDSSKMAIQPCFSSSSTAGRLATKRASWASGLRLDSRRNKITEGLLSFRKANSVPKSVSAETTIRSSRAARAKITSSSASCSP